GAAGGFSPPEPPTREGGAAEANAEPIRTCAAAGLPLQISHISVVSRLTDASRWAVEQALEQVREARRRGQDVTFDMHTRLFGTTNLSAALPPWALEGDRAAVARRLADPAARREMKNYRSIITGLARGDWGRIVLFGSKGQPELRGRSIAEISTERGLDP